MNREVHVRFREEQGVKIPLLTRLAAVLFFLGQIIFLSIVLLIFFHVFVFDLKA